jgi:hypothetical protein
MSVCDECGGTVRACEECKKRFKRGDEIICRHDGFNNKHFCSEVHGEARCVGAYFARNSHAFAVKEFV